ncbi:MAG: rRNA pseudouridine synthase [Cryomorphaceae bacterium]|jgi:23S rRNA pseudouridine2605 synthase|nr:rRNA pseudouridine synthase [Cryomorphaceae bacterium]
MRQPKKTGAKPKAIGSKPRATGAKDAPKVSARDKRKYIDYKIKVKKGDPLPSFREDAIRLNKFLSNAGICSRREADVLIETGVVSINGTIITELGYKVKPEDVVQYDGETITTGTKRYVLLNKPKGYITAIDDPRGRKTVMALVSKACKEQIFPVGRMDRETTGLMLFTNDGDMMKKLLHPRYHARKLYQIETNKSVAREDLEKLTRGIDLEDGRIKAEAASFVEGGQSNEIGVEIRSGKNQVVRRMIEALGYQVIKLDRVVYAGLTKKDLPRGYYRHLTEQEVAFLKMSK